MKFHPVLVWAAMFLAALVVGTLISAIQHAPAKQPQPPLDDAQKAFVVQCTIRMSEYSAGRVTRCIEVARELKQRRVAFGDK